MKLHCSLNQISKLLPKKRPLNLTDGPPPGWRGKLDAAGVGFIYHVVAPWAREHTEKIPGGGT